MSPTLARRYPGDRKKIRIDRRKQRARFTNTDFVAFSASSRRGRSTNRQAGPAGTANSAARPAWRTPGENPVKAWKNTRTGMARALRLSERNKSIRTIR